MKTLNLDDLQAQTLEELLDYLLEQVIDNKWTYEQREAIEKTYNDLKGS